MQEIVDMRLDYRQVDRIERHDVCIDAFELHGPVVTGQTEDIGHATAVFDIFQ